MKGHGAKSRVFFLRKSLTISNNNKIVAVDMASKLDGGFAVVQSGGLFYVIIPSSGVIAIRKGFKTLADARNAYGEKKSIPKEVGNAQRQNRKGEKRAKLVQTQEPAGRA